MSNDHERAGARDRAALEWLAGYDPADGYGHGIGWEAARDPAMMFTQPVVIDAFNAGADHAEAEFAVERATGQCQLDEAAALMREAAELFRSYEAHHRRKVDKTLCHGSTDPAEEKAERNALMADRLELWMAGESTYPVNPAEALREIADGMVDGETIKGVDHQSIDDAAAYLTEPLHDLVISDEIKRYYSPRGDVHPLYDTACRWPGMPIPAVISEAGDIVPVDEGHTREDCRARFHNVVNFGGFPSTNRRELRDHRGDCPAGDGFGFECRCAELDRQDDEEEAGLAEAAGPGSGLRTNVRPVTVGPLADPEVVKDILAVSNTPDTGRSLSMATATAFRLHTGDPRFDHTKPVVVNGYLYHPATEA